MPASPLVFCNPEIDSTERPLEVEHDEKSEFDICESDIVYEENFDEKVLDIYEGKIDRRTKKSYNCSTCDE